MYLSADHDMLGSSASLLTTSVAIAAARKRTGAELTDVDRGAVTSMIVALQSEVSVLRGEREADIRDQSAYAVAGYTLNEVADIDGDQAMDEARAATKLEDLTSKLNRLLDAAGSVEEARLLEKLFLATGRRVSLGLSGTGESLHGPSLVFAS